MSVPCQGWGPRRRGGARRWRSAGLFSLAVVLVASAPLHPATADAQGSPPAGAAATSAASTPSTAAAPAALAVARAEPPPPPGPSSGTDGSVLDAPLPAPGAPPAPGGPAPPAGPTDPAALAPLPGFTGGGTLAGDNRLPAPEGPGRPPGPAPSPGPATGTPGGSVVAALTERPVMLLSPAAAAPLEAEVLEATTRRDSAARRLEEARAATEAARDDLARLDAELARTTGELHAAEASVAAARETLTRAAVAWYIGDVQPPDLSAELLDHGARTARARREVSAAAALDRRLALLGDARAAADSLRDRRARIEGRLGAAGAELAGRTQLQAAADEELVRTSAELAERAGRLDRLRLRVDPAVEGLEGADSGGVTFPVAGPFDFLDSWGFPRSGGRRHRGSDVFAPNGTPVVAIEDGVARADADPLGGLTVYLTGRSGFVYYHAHLHAIEPAVTAAGAAGRPVRAGEVLGLVGNTGNAQGGAPHLHIQIAPAGGDWVNPYPLLSRLAGAVIAARNRGVTSDT